ncbi:MAG TPA: hypothetical protein VNH15_00815 [Elusimicrobiota bacterium]|nr:hypothetical protein [Elusimicrobiota bacterium]
MNASFFARSCQCAGLALLCAAFLPRLSSAAAPEVGVSSAGFSMGGFANEVSSHPKLASFFRRLSQLDLEGSASLNWRNVGPRYPQYEAQIQDELYLADMYFGLGGPIADGMPFLMEWNAPTSNEGQIQLSQLNVEYDRLKNTRIEAGKFLVPFGRYNELYRPDDFLTVTRPLLFSSPDSLDLVVRLNSPRPPLTVGYTDVGARVSYYPTIDNPLIPDEITFFVVNGLGEETNRLRTFPNTDNLGVPPIPGNGTNIDFGHQNNNLADNNNAKSPGARVIFALGDLRLPWPIPEKISDLNGVNLGLSAMGGEYNLEGNLNYQIYDADLTFEYKGINFASEYVYSLNQFLAPLETSPGAFSNASNVTLAQDYEINQGYYVQASFPVMKKPPMGKQLTGVLVLNQMWRRGPAEDLFFDQTLNGTQYSSLDALNPSRPRATTQMDKYTAALNYQVSNNFWIKLEWSYWVLGRATDGNVYPGASSSFENNSVLPNSLGRVNVYQTALSFVVGF